MTWMSRGLKAELSQYLGSSFLECCEGDLQVNFSSVQFSSVAQLCPTLQPHESQHARSPCPSPTPGVHSDSRLKGSKTNMDYE